MSGLWGGEVVGGVGGGGCVGGVGGCVTTVTPGVSGSHTMVIVSHSISFLEGLADQLLYMEGGEVVESGEADKLLNSPSDPRTKDFLQQAK